MENINLKIETNNGTIEKQGYQEGHFAAVTLLRRVQNPKITVTTNGNMTTPRRFTTYLFAQLGDQFQQIMAIEGQVRMFTNNSKGTKNVNAVYNTASNYKDANGKYRSYENVNVCEQAKSVMEMSKLMAIKNINDCVASASNFELTETLELLTAEMETYEHAIPGNGVSSRKDIAKANESIIVGV